MNHRGVVVLGLAYDMKVVCLRPVFRQMQCPLARSLAVHWCTRMSFPHPLAEND